MKTRLLIGGVVVLALLGLSSVASAQRFTSSGYTIDASQIGASFGGDSSSAGYELTSTGGESIIGQGSGGSYKLDSGYVAQLQSSMQLAVQPSGLVAYYPLDETSGAFVRDYSASDFHGDSANDPTHVSGKVGDALDFDGATQNAEVGDTDSFTGSEFTVEAWVKTTTGGATMAAFAKGSNFWLGLDFGKAAFFDWTTAQTCKITTPTIADGSWHHIAATLDSGVSNGSYIYLDGDQGTACTWTPVSQTNRRGVIGAAPSGGSSFSQHFDGSIDNIKIFNRILSENEIKAEYNAGVAGNPAGLSFATDIIAGTSQTSPFDAIVLTDTPKGYTIAVNQNQNLTNGAYTIPGVSGSVASPATWSEGTTKGLGFTLFGTNATAIDGKWSSGSAYAAFPGSATSVYTRSGAQSTKDVLNMRLRLDVASAQEAGTYSNVITTTGTLTP